MMPHHDIERLASIKTFHQLIKYLRDELDWPIDVENHDDLTFEYQPEELGLDAKTAVKIKDIKQLRPLITGQPWGIFFLNFEPKQLPVVVLRRILQKLVIKKRETANKSQLRSWNLHDLLFISSYGEESSRSLTFAHFSEEPETGELPTLRVLGWDDQDTVLHLDHAHATLKEKLSWPSNPSDLDSWHERWSSAFTLKHREVITTSKDLAIRLAALAIRIRKRVNAILRVESEKGPFTQLHQAFKEALIHDLNEDDFADMYAQTITYGLLAARVSRPTGVVTENLAQLVSNPFLKETLSTFLTVGGKKGKLDFDEAGILDVVDLLNSSDTNIEAVLRDFGNRTQREDPVIHFYELFLTEYDKKKKVERGVFYTPQPVVSYIVRSVHELLQTEFGLEDGLASIVTWGEIKRKNKDITIPKGVSVDEPFVQILDPAIGTGTFLVEVIDIVAKTMLAKWDKVGQTQNQIQKLWNEYVGKNLLPRMYGYELMMAPYVIADIKLTLKLTEISRQFGELFYHSDGKGRFNIYLTNSLEPPSQVADDKLADLFLPLAHEAKAVNEIKREKRFTVVIGNPPYAGISSNMNEHAQRIVDAYKTVDGLALNERKLWLQDDYVKFIRIGQSTLEETMTGVFGYITNHSYIDNPTFRGMRQSLIKTFQRIYFLDLHGNANKKEQSPDGDKDENVFDIMQGVGIIIAAKNHKHNDNGKSYHSDLWGSRESKYERLSHATSGRVRWLELQPQSPRYLLIPQNLSYNDEYNAGWSVPEILPISSTGIITSRDGFVTDFEDQPIMERIATFLDPALGDKVVKERLELSENYAWRVSDARKQLRVSKKRDKQLRNILWHPFDIRRIFYHPSVVWRTREEVMRHMAGGNNLALLVSRQVTREFRHAYITNMIANFNTLDSAGRFGSGPFFPLYVNITSSGPDDDMFDSEGTRQPNLARGFLDALAMKLELSQVDPYGLPKTVIPEDIIHFVYAVLHSPHYRKRYAEFLKADFPRIPITSRIELFRAMSKLGDELVALHIMESPKLDKHVTKFVGKEFEVEKVTYSDSTVWIDKSQTSGFKGVQENVWEFQIGGYQVCEKWLKDRKGRELSKEDIEHYHRIVVALNETIRLMSEIDKVIDEHGGWPIR